MFDDIRPFNDAEVQDVVRRTVRDPEMLQAIRGLVFGRWPATLSVLLEPLIGLYLRWQVRNVTSIDKLQRVTEKYFRHAVETTTDGFTVSGMHNVPKDGSCLFIGNHRDIVLDPAFMSLALSRSGLETCRVAIGDNLLSKPYVSDLMRMNKGFVVKRSETGPRQMFKAYQQLSEFIKHSIVEERASVWLAQREGRAKDANDRTEPAIIKMLQMSGKKSGFSLSEQLKVLRIVPVCISYEFDPCDQLKAKELLAIQNGETYVKTEHEDISSIAAGISGAKGRVHLTFCESLQGDFESPEKVAATIDRGLHAHYHLHPSNLVAYELDCLKDGAVRSDQLQTIRREVFGASLDEAKIQRKTTEFAQRLENCPEALRQIVIAMYAMPVKNRLALGA